MNDFPLLRTFHQDFRSHEEVNVEISIVSHGFTTYPRSSQTRPAITIN
ncbi:transposase like domain protein, partial [Escherichia coli 97.1742]